MTEWALEDFMSLVNYPNTVYFVTHNTSMQVCTPESSKDSANAKGITGLYSNRDFP